MIRVLHFLSQVKVTSFFEGLAAHTDRKRFELSVCALDGHGLVQERLAAYGVRGFALDCPTYTRAGIALFRLVHLLRRERFDVLHTHLFLPSAIGQVAGLVARTPCLAMTRWHSDLHFVLGKPWHSRVDGLTARLAHRVMAISNHTRDVLVDREGVPAERVRVIYPGCAPTSYAYGGQLGGVRDSGLARQLGLDGAVVVGTVARLATAKNHRLLLEAIPLVVAKNPEVKFLLIGEGPLRDELVALAEALGISRSVSFLGFRADVERLYEVMDLVVHPPIEEAYGFAIVEAMVRGLPVVSTPRGIAAEIIRSGENGLLVPPDAPGMLADAINQLVASPELRARLGGAARASVEGRFSFATVARAYEESYLECLGL